MHTPQDHEYLLSLELLKRFKSQEFHVFHQLNREQEKLLEAESEYRNLFEAYLQLVQDINTYMFLKNNEFFRKDEIAGTEKDIRFLRNQIQIGQKIECLNQGVLEKLKEQLNSTTNFGDLKTLREKIDENHKILKAIETISKDVKANLTTLPLEDLEKATAQLEDILINKEEQ